MNQQRCLSCVLVLAMALQAAAAPTPQPTTRPAGAIVLFDGKDMSAWQNFHENRTLGFQIVDGAVDLEKSNAVTRRSFGDFRLYLEFRCPENAPEITGQKHGNSGVYLHDRYEIQILGHRGNAIPDDHGVGAIYGIKRPDALAVRPDGQWQSFDITFRAPRFDANGMKAKDARVTIRQNGTVIHDDVPIPKVTGGARGAEAPTGPIRLQDKNHAVQFRNIWVVPLDEK